MTSYFVAIFLSIIFFAEVIYKMLSTKLSCFLCVLFCAYVNSTKIDGRLSLPNDHSIDTTKVIVDDGKYQGFLK